MSAPSTTIRKVFKIRDNVDRQEVKKLWIDGKVCGMFNIPNESVFDACVDFCIEPASEDIVMTKQELEQLRQSKHIMVTSTAAASTASTTSKCDSLEKTVQTLTKQLDDLKDSFASKSGELVIEIERRRDAEARLAKLESVDKQQQKSIARLERQLDAERTSSSALQSKSENLEQLNSKLVAQLRELRSMSAEKDKQIASFNDDSSQLREDLKSERISVRDLFLENKVLIAKIEELTKALQTQLSERQTSVSTKRSSFNALTHPESSSAYQPPLLNNSNDSSPPGFTASTTTTTTTTATATTTTTTTTREITQTDHLNAQLLASAMRMDFSFVNNRIGLMSSNDVDDLNDPNNNKW